MKKSWTFKGFLHALKECGIMGGIALAFLVVGGGSLFGLFELTKWLIDVTNFVIGLIIALVVILVLFAFVAWFFKGDDCFD